uniref:Gamma-glutamylcyclotransferase n=1 Tax=Steinernema glaseri TaxID=37863 RepID=A0A1I7Z156_9BILA
FWRAISQPVRVSPKTNHSINYFCGGSELLPLWVAHRSQEDADEQLSALDPTLPCSIYLTSFKEEQGRVVAEVKYILAQNNGCPAGIAHLG